MRNGLSKWDKFERSMDTFNNTFEGMLRPFFYDSTSVMKTDVTENDKEYLLDIEMPGFDKSDIEIDTEDGYIVVKAEKHEKEEDADNYLCRERQSSCTRSYYLGDFEEEAIKAKYKHGVLSLVVPKIKEKEKTKHSINIE